MNTEPVKTSNEDIDLGIFFSLLKHIVKSINSALSAVFLLCRKYFVVVFSLTSLGISLGLCYFFFSKPLYRTSMIATTVGVRNDYCEDLINKLNQIVEDDSPELLAKKLNISKEYAEKIAEIKFENLDDERMSEDSIPIGLPFRIYLSVYDKKVIDSMQYAIVNYMESNEFLLKRKRIRIQNIDVISKRIEQEIRDIDSLKTIIASAITPRNIGSGLIYGEPLDPINTYRDGFKMFEKKLDLITELSLIDNIQVVDGFLIRQKPDRPKLLIDIIIGGLGGFITALLMARRRNRKVAV